MHLHVCMRACTHTHTHKDPPDGVNEEAEEPREQREEDVGAGFASSVCPGQTSLSGSVSTPATWGSCQSLARAAVVTRRLTAR